MFSLEEYKAAAVQHDLEVTEDGGCPVLSRGGKGVLKVVGEPGNFVFEPLVDCAELAIKAGRKLFPSDQYDIPQHAASAAAGLCGQLRIKAPAKLVAATPAKPEKVSETRFGGSVGSKP